MKCKLSFAILFISMSFNGLAQESWINEHIKLNFKVKGKYSYDSFDKQCQAGVIYDFKTSKNTDLTMVVYMADTFMQGCEKTWHNNFVPVKDFETVQTKHLTFELRKSKWDGSGGDGTGDVWQYKAIHNGRHYWVYFFNREIDNVLTNPAHEKLINDIINSMKPMKD